MIGLVPFKSKLVCEPGKILLWTVRPAEICQHIVLSSDNEQTYSSQSIYNETFL